MKDDVEFDYDYLMQKALRGLMQEVLEIVADLGDAPGEHHFYLEFLTGAPGVSIPDHLKEEYPERMTIVLQHQFQNLTVDDNGLGVTLWFKGKETRLEVPFDAVTSFADPSVQFGLRFVPPEDKGAKPAPEEDEDSAAATNGDTAGDDKPAEDDAPAPKGEGADIVSLDAFRKK